jgi:membrane fusion protein (multidrug efflux system)
MRWWLLTLWLAVGATLPGCDYFSGGSDDKEEDGDDNKKPPEPITVVALARVTLGAVAEVLSASAAIEAEASADLMPAANGMVVQVLKDVGDVVTRGQVLAVINNASLDASAERARSEVAHLEARLQEMKQLESSGAVSAREVADIDYQLRTARTTLREATAGQGETRITAPFDGVVASRDVKVGEQVSAASRAFQVVDLSLLRVNASMPERDVAKVALGQTARLISAYDATQTAMATVTRISPVIDATTGTFQVTLTLQADPHTLRPGQFVSVELEVDRREGVLIAPREAVLYENGVPVVYRKAEAPPEPVEKEDEADADKEEAKEEDTPEEPAEPPGPRYIAERVVVKLGLTDATSAEILAGLAEGDEIVVVGHTNLKDGARIREPGEQAVPAAAAEPEPPGEEG